MQISASILDAEQGSAASAFGGKAANICSSRAFPLMTDAVEKVADDLRERFHLAF
jgi:hypothetical protein